MRGLGIPEMYYLLGMNKLYPPHIVYQNVSSGVVKRQL